jgi:hypothetical protein
MVVRLLPFPFAQKQGKRFSHVGNKLGVCTNQFLKRLLQGRIFSESKGRK